MADDFYIDLMNGLIEALESCSSLEEVQVLADEMKRAVDRRHHIIAHDQMTYLRESFPTCVH